MDRKKPKHGSHWVVDHHPNRKKKPFRLRWKKLKPLGITDQAEFKVLYFANQKEAVAFASKKVEEAQKVGDAAKGLDPSEKAEIIRVAARLKSRGIDPILALEEGADAIKTFGGQADTPIGHFWQEYLDTRKGGKVWGDRHLRSQEKFHEDTEKTFMALPVKTFIRSASGTRAVREALEKYRSKSTRNANNTIRAAKSKMKSFLSFVASNVDALPKATVGEIFSDPLNVLPVGMRKEAKNEAINTDQAKYLIAYMAKQKLAGWIVFKLFTGARTLLLQQWQWSIVDWEKGMIRIPKEQTKLKMNAIHYSISEVPNLKEWLKWAWEIDGKPAPDKKIAHKSQPTITKHIAKAMNQKKELFIQDKRKKIVPMDTHRNFMRSGFITYGIEIIGVGKVSKIAEDRHNLDKYLASDSATDGEPEAEKFFALRSSNIAI